MKQIKVTSKDDQEPSGGMLLEYNGPPEDDLERLKDEINELRKELKRHIQNCPFRSLY